MRRGDDGRGREDDPKDSSQRETIASILIGIVAGLASAAVGLGIAWLARVAGRSDQEPS